MAAHPKEAKGAVRLDRAPSRLPATFAGGILELFSRESMGFDIRELLGIHKGETTPVAPHVETAPNSTENTTPEAPSPSTVMPEALKTPDNQARIDSARRWAKRLAVGGPVALALVIASVACASAVKTVIESTATPDTEPEPTDPDVFEGIPVDQIHSMLLSPEKWDEFLGPTLGGYFTNVVNEIQGIDNKPTCVNPQMLLAYHPDLKNGWGLCTDESRPGHLPIVFGGVSDNTSIRGFGEVTIQHETENPANYTMSFEGEEGPIAVASFVDGVMRLRMPASSVLADEGSIVVDDAPSLNYLKNIQQLLEQPPIFETPDGVEVVYTPEEIFEQQLEPGCILTEEQLADYSDATKHPNGVDIQYGDPLLLDPDTDKPVTLLPEGAADFAAILKEFKLKIGAEEVRLAWNCGAGEDAAYTVLAFADGKMYRLLLRYGNDSYESGDTYSSMAVAGPNTQPDEFVFELMDLPPGVTPEQVMIEWRDDKSHQIGIQGVMGQAEYVRDAVTNAWIKNPVYLEGFMLPAGASPKLVRVLNAEQGQALLAVNFADPSNDVDLMRLQFTVNALGDKVGVWETLPGVLPTVEPTTLPTVEPTVEPTHIPEPTPDPTKPFVPPEFLEKVKDPLTAALHDFESVMEPLGNAENPYARTFNFMVYDLWVGDIPLTSTSGELLATAKISIIAVYLKPDGSVDWVVIPFNIRDKNGILIHQTTTIYPTQLGDESLEEIAQAYEGRIAWSIGNIRWAEISADPDLAFQSNPGHYSETKAVTGDIIREYTQGREGEINAFLENGDSNNHMVIFPIYEDNAPSSSGKVVLP